jgi:superfamily II DNA helicase RecQ
MASNDPITHSPEDQYILNSHRIFGILPYHWQASVGGKIVRAHINKTPLKLLLVRPTGSGKTLVFATAASIIKGITICITPLLSLGADQSNKIMEKTRHRDKSILSFHLDEMSNQELIKLHHFFNSPESRFASKTILLFTSPQRIVTRPGSGNDLLKLLIRKMLIKFIVVDEIHLVAHYGRSFRSEFGKLGDELFSRVDHLTPMLFMTATCTRSIHDSFQMLIGGRNWQFTDRDWPGAFFMQHRSVSLNFKYTTQASANVKKHLKSMLEEDNSLPKKCIVYSNFRRRVQDFSQDLAEYLDTSASTTHFDIITLIGTQFREQKAKYINCFISDNTTEAFNPHILCATSGVGNAGIDCAYIRSVYRLDCPPSIVDICQEKGRAGRQPGAHPSVFGITICFSLESFLLIFKRIHDPSEDIIDDSYRQEQFQDLMNVARLMVANSCQSIAIELFLANPFTGNNSSVLNPCRSRALNVEGNSSLLSPCGTCTFCNGIKLFPVLQRSGVCHMLFDLFISGPNIMSSTKEMNNVVKSIVDYPTANRLLFNSRSVKVEPIKVKKMLFLLIAAEIIELVLVNGEIQLSLARSQSPYGNQTNLAMNENAHWNIISSK